jgi:hypothetical protein
LREHARALSDHTALLYVFLLLLDSQTAHFLRYETPLQEIVLSWVVTVRVLTDQSIQPVVRLGGAFAATATILSFAVATTWTIGDAPWLVLQVRTMTSGYAFPFLRGDVELIRAIGEPFLRR